MKHFRPIALPIALLISGWSALGCGSSDPTSSDGKGGVSFTTWGEEYIEQEIPVDGAASAGFIDGWSVKYEKFLVNFQNIVIANSKGETAAQIGRSELFNNQVPGVKPIALLEGIPAKAWDRVSYQIAPVTEGTELSSSATAADKQLMIDGQFAIYVAANATKGNLSKHFAWGFAIATQYNECHSEQDGKDEAGLVVNNNSTIDVQLTTHGDHLYYDRLQASPDPAIKTSLRFDTLAAADKNNDNEITLEELNAAPLDVKLYDPSGLGAATQGAFVTSLVRTIGHFRGEGECTVSKL